MKRIAPLLLVAVAAVIAVILVDRHRDQAVAYTENRAAWDAYVEGEALLQSFRYPEAEAKLREAIALDPDLAMAQVALAEVSFRLSNYDDVKVHYILADSLAGLVDDPDARLLLEVRLSGAEISWYHGQRDSLLDEARQRHPDHLIVLLAEAMEAQRDGDLNRAEELFQHILEINPNYASAYNFLGYLYLGQGKYDDAEMAMRRYAFVAPDLANPHDSLGEVLMTVGRYEEAIEQFKTALAKQPDFFYSHVNIGRIYFLRGQIDDALALMGKVVDSLEGSPRARMIEADVVDWLYKLRLNADLEVYADRYIAKHGDEPKRGVNSVRIKRLLGLGQPVAAMTLVDSVATEYADMKWYGENIEETAKVRIPILRYRAVAAEQMGAHEEAARLFQEVLTLMQSQPPHASLFERIHLAYNLIPLGAYDEARIQIRDAVSINPRIPEGILVAASIEAAAGQDTDALKLLDSLDRILETADPDYPVIMEAQQLRQQLPDPDRI